MGFFHKDLRIENVEILISCYTPSSPCHLVNKPLPGKVICLSVGLHEEGKENVFLNEIQNQIIAKDMEEIRKERAPSKM